MINEKTEPLEIVDELNTYFANIGKNLVDDIPPSNLELNFDANPTIPFLTLNKTTVAEVQKLLMAISDAKATGDDEIPIHFIKISC